MKAYNTPKDELLIKSDEGEELVKITPEKTTIANLEAGGGGSAFIVKMGTEADRVTVTFDKTYAEIVAAFNSDETIIGKLYNMQTSELYVSEGFCSFFFKMISANKLYIDEFRITDNNITSRNSYNVSLT